MFFRRARNQKGLYDTEFSIDKYMHILIATSKDSPDIASLHYHAVRNLCKNDYTPEQLQAWASAENLKPENNAFLGVIKQSPCCVVASINGQKVGFASLRPLSSPDFLWHLYVHPQFAGRGIGAALLGRMEEEAIRLHPEIFCLTLKSSKNAFAFYEKYGYGAIKEEFVAMGDQMIEVLVMKKII